MTDNPNNKPDPDGDEAERLSGIYQFYYQPQLLLAFLMCSWWTSYTGVVAMADWITGASEATQYLAFLVTLTAMGSQYALWHYAMRLIPRFVTGRARLTGLLVVLILMVLLAFSSTFTSFIGISQDSARGMELQIQADVYDGNSRLLARRASAMEDALFVIRPQAETACVRYEQELQSGVITGSRGKGAVTNYLLGFCTGKSGIVEALETTIAANAARINEIASASARLDQVIFDQSRPMRDREQEFLRLARQMDAALQALQNADRTRGLRAINAAMAGSVRELDGQTSALGQRQAEAIKGIIAEEQASGAAIAELIDEIEALPLPEAGRANLKPAQTLVLEHRMLHLPQLTLALAIDLFAPLSTLLFWAAAMRARPSKPRRRKPRRSPSNRKGDQ